MKLNVFLALDIDNKAQALRAAQLWAPHIKGLKVGPRLGFQLTDSDWSDLASLGEVFLDYKFFDIPSTVESAVKRAFSLGVSYCTVHAFNGCVCLSKLAKLEQELNAQRPFKILCVTVLTSFDETQNPLPLSQSQPLPNVVKGLASVVFESGLTGIVCSPLEVQSLKVMHPSGFFVTPGVRFDLNKAQDQKRVTTPQEAWQYGASYLVMGRALLNSCENKAQVASTFSKLEQQWQNV